MNSQISQNYQNNNQNNSIKIYDILDINSLPVLTYTIKDNTTNI